MGGKRQINYQFIPTDLFRGCPLIRGLYTKQVFRDELVVYLSFSSHKIYIYTYIYIYIYIYTHTHTHTYTHTCIHIYIHTYITYIYIVYINYNIFLKFYYFQLREYKLIIIFFSY